MTEYIYLPVPSSEMEQMARDMQKTRLREKANLPFLVHNAHLSGYRKGMAHILGDGCLKKVQGGDTVYLLIHGTGAADSETISAKRILPNGVEERKRYTPKEIAHTLEKEGLTKSLVDLKLLVCGAGLVGTKSSMGQRIFEALKKRGYGRIRVTAYLGNVKVGSSSGYMVNRQTTPGNWELISADQGQVVYG
ncbi:hypothetical protein DFR24_1572 [Panacagrimonas perspica]|uniref:Uncharacterized protein n=1 Tax=Panacagrimonas perspica TaxID=381431 RepID=A0A4R7PDF6_9GAMM|nr:hypothetical protein [Panacagrimonas perspica]TDU32183.1 hypothetical protein DFR24_1572 [Panacagrimonas perspica]THD01118.1 hypothetical protein B1810_21230 [Panacagrimonas perspica]